MNNFISKVIFFTKNYSNIRLELALRNLMSHNLDWCHEIKPIKQENLETYTKYHLYENDKINLCKIYWNSYSKSPIHGHPEKGCILKVLDGVLIEHNYENNKFTHSRSLYKNNICMKYGYINTHQIITCTPATSLHLYLID